MYRVSSDLPRFALALLAGAGLGTAWVNLGADSYYDAIEYRLVDLPLPPGFAALPFSLTPLTLVSGGLMALVMALLAKELWETLRIEHPSMDGPDGQGVTLRLGLMAVLGGILGAVLAWGVAGQLLPWPAEAWPGAGWPMVIGGDVILAHAFGRRLLGPRHPGLHLLLMTGVAFDVLGLLAMGLAYPPEGLAPGWLGLSLAAIALVWALVARHAHPGASQRRQRRAAALWPYALAGLASWAGVVLAGLPGALGLVPLIPVIPHARQSFGLFAEAEALSHDPLNRLARALRWPVAASLFLFGLTRLGIDAGALSPVTLATVLALVVGKPLGLVFGIGLALALGLSKPIAGLGPRGLGRVALLTGLGLTVPALAIDATLPGGAMAEAARLGLALTLLPAALAAALARPPAREPVANSNPLGT